MTIWASSQGHFALRDHTARILGVPVSKVKVIPMEIGGGFGGKGQGGCYIEPVVAALARKTGRPVKMQMSRIEVFMGTGPTSGTHIRVKLGATNAGKLVAADCTLIYEAGAFPGSPVPSGCRTMLGPLRNRQLVHRGVRRSDQRAEVGGLPGSRLPARVFCRRTGR